MLGSWGAEASELLKIMVFDDLSAAAICHELVLVGAFVFLVVAAVSELPNSVLFAALSAAALFCKVSIVGAFVFLACAAVSELLNSVLLAALSAVALFFTVTTVVAIVIWVVVAAFELLKARLSSALSAAAFCYELASVGAFAIVVVASAAALQVSAEFFEAQRPFYASQAEANEVSQISGERAARSFKVQNSCTEGGLNKGCFFVTDLTGKTLTMTSPLDSSVSSLARDIRAFRWNGSTLWWLGGC